MYSVVKIKSYSASGSDKQEEKFPDRFKTYAEANRWVTNNTSLFEFDPREKISAFIKWKIVSEV